MSIRATGGRASSALLAFMVCAGASGVHGQQVYHVDDDARAGGDGLSWNRAFQDLQDALAIATSGDEVWVAAGTYEPSVPSFRTATFSIPSGVRVYGGFDGTEASLGDRGDPFDNVSVLDGFIGPGQRVYSVVTFDGTDAATTLDGFRIIRGEANSTGENETSDGGGIYMTQAAATLRNLRIENNDATLAGGGLSIRDGRQDELTIIEDCVFEGNACAADGGALAFDAPVEIRGSTFQNNTSGERGGAVFDNNPGITVISDSEFRFNEVNPTPGASGLTGAYFIERDSGQVTMSSCLFIGNRAPEDGAVSIVGNGLYEFLGCRFYGNVSESPDPTVSQAGGAINLREAIPGGSVIIDTCLFSGNFTERGRGTVVNRRFQGELFLFNSTLSRNTVDTGPTGGVFTGVNETTMIASILWNNSGGDADPQQDNLDGTGFVDINGCIIEDFFGSVAYPGSNNSDADPMFIDADGTNNIAGDLDDNVMLRPGSPAIDSGNNLAVDPRITEDVFGNPRFADDTGTPDTGTPDGVNPQADIGAAEFRFTSNCDADTNNDGQVNAADFNAWIAAFNAGAPQCDQNGDGLCDPSDFNAWILNFNAGC